MGQTRVSVCFVAVAAIEKARQAFFLPLLLGTLRGRADVGLTSCRRPMSIYAKIAGHQRLMTFHCVAPLNSPFPLLRAHKTNVRRPRLD